MLKIVSLALGLGAVGAGLVTTRVVAQNSGHRTERVFDLSVSGQDAHRFDIHAPVASIEIETGNSSDVSVHAVRWTTKPDSAGGRHWLEDAHLTLVRSGDTVTLEDTLAKQDGAGGGSREMNGGLELRIKAPKSLDFHVRVGAGSVKPKGDMRSADIHVGAGDVVGRFEIEQSSQVHVGAGSVQIEVPESENLDVDASAGVGEVKGLPEAETRKNGMHIGDKRSGRFGAGGPDLSIKVGAGSIKIDSPVAAGRRSVEESSGSRSQELWADDSAWDGGVIDVGPIVTNAMSTANLALRQAQEPDQDLSDIGPEIEKAMSSLGPELDKTMSQIGPEIEKAMSEIQPQLDKDMENVGPDVERAMAKLRPQLERIQKSVRLKVEKSLPTMEKAMREAQASLEKAIQDLDRREAGKETMDESTRKTVREALRAAESALKESMKETRKSMDEALKEMNQDKD